MKYIVGNKVKFAEEKMAYTIKAVSDRYIICTKPFNPKKTVLYTIVDLDKHIRGTDNMIFCGGYATQEDIDSNMKKLISGETEISHRNNIPLYIDHVI